jgi:hypothetical protein
MNENKTKIKKEDIYKNETQIANEVGASYNNTMCHRMKEKDTFNTVLPTNGLWKSDVVFKTTNETLRPLSYKDPYFDDTFYFKMNKEKEFNEEMAKTKNMMINKKKEDNKDKK